MKGHGFGLERLGHLAIAWPKAALVVLVLVTAACGWGMTRVTFDDDLRALLSSKREAFIAYERFREAFPDQENRVFLLVEGDALSTAQGLEAVRNLHLEVQFADGVTGVFSIFSARRPPGPDGNTAALFPEELPSGDALAGLIEEARAHPLLAGKMLSRDGGATLVIVTLRRDIQDRPALATVLEQVNKAIAFATKGSGLTVTATGSPVFRYEILETIRHDLQMLNVLGTLVALSVCFLLFRRPIWVMLASIAPLAGVVWSVGGFGLTGEPITALSNILPTLVLVIGFSDALHMVNALRRRVMRGEDVTSAVTASVTQIGPACAMTSVTTMIALASLLLSESEVVRQFALAGALAVFGAFIAVITIIPAMAMLLLPFARDERVARETVFLSGARALSARLWRMVAASPGPIVVVAAMVLTATGATFFALKSNYDYREYLSAKSAANLAIDRINARLGGADPIHLFVERTDPAAGEAATEAAITAAHDALSDVAGVENVVSIASVRSWLESAGGVPSLTMNEVIERMPDHARGRFVSDDDQKWLVSAYIPARPAPETLEVLGRVDAQLEPVRASAPGYSFTVTGVIPMAATQSGYLIDRLKNSLMFAILVIMLVIGVTARSARLALFAAVPNLLSLTVVADALFLAGAGFQFTSAVALTVAFGIAVDNTVHFLHRFRLESADADVAQALSATMEKVGPVLMAATAVLALGMAVTQASALPMVVLFGRLCMVILCAALVVTLSVLPALILVMAPSKARET